MKLRELYYLHEIGSKRKQEDTIWPQPGEATSDQRVFVVCDGVGGAENGEVASSIVAEWTGASISRISFQALTTETINDVLSEARSKLRQYAHEYGLNEDMATTFTLLVLDKKEAFVAWCGDSRVYHIRDGETIYKTSDHSLVNSLVKKGELTEDEANSHPNKNIILKAIKADESPIEAETHKITDIRNGDYFMLCTDGLLENITEDDLRFLIRQNELSNIDLVESFQQFCRDKTRDNYSMYLVKIEVESRILSL